MHLYLLSFLLVCCFMYQSMKQPPPVPWKLKLRHFIATAAVAVLTSEDTYAVFYVVTHPQLALAGFYVPKGYLPAGLVFVLRVGSMILGALVWTEAGALAARKPKARRAFLRVWPFLIIIWLIQYVAVVQEHGLAKNPGYFWGFYILGSGIILFISWAIYWHFRSSSSDDLFLSN